MNFDISEKILNKKVFIDSRLVKENSIFICIRGPNNDGHKFAKKLLNKFQ